MERLTERNKYGVVYFGNIGGIAVRGSDFNVDYHMKHHPDVIKRRLEALDKAIDRLAYYEDMEEQGRLVAVKCKECVYFENREGYMPYCAHPSCIVGDGVGEEFYCPNGERKKGLENALKGGADK